ncbi:MAG: ribosome-associated protein [Candidatus Azotimanducaceae bacterium]|jgi:ribosome-associated protein
MLTITPTITLEDDEYELKAIRAQGPGGQNVNKVSSAIHLRFDIGQSSLPEHVKQALLNLKDSRITRDGCVVIKAQQFRTQEKNREDGLGRLRELIVGVTKKQKVRRPTKPSRAAKQRRMDSKTKRGRSKNLRGKVTDD